MSDMMLPFKLLSAPTPDTSAQTAKDTRALASGEALQRLKTSGAMDLQRRKGADTLRNTAFQLGYGLSPDQAETGMYNPDQQAGLKRLQTAVEIGKFAPGLANLFRAGVGPKLTAGTTIQDLPTIGLRPSEFPGGQAARLGKTTLQDDVTIDDIVAPDNKPLSPFAKRKRKQSKKVQTKAPDATTATVDAAKANKVSAPQPDDIPPQGIPWYNPKTRQSGRVYGVAGKYRFIPDPE
jgi:hypothetical protein